jgi:hypothetical protein
MRKKKMQMSVLLNRTSPLPYMVFWTYLSISTIKATKCQFIWNICWDLYIKHQLSATGVMHVKQNNDEC